MSPRVLPSLKKFTKHSNTMSFAYSSLVELQVFFSTDTTHLTPPHNLLACCCFGAHLPHCCTGTPRCCTPVAWHRWSSAPAGSCPLPGRRHSTASALSGRAGAGAARPTQSRGWAKTHLSISLLCPSEFYVLTNDHTNQHISHQTLLPCTISVTRQGREDLGA